MTIQFDETNRYIVSINISTEKGTVKKPVETVIVNETGIDGDAHSGRWHRQISMLAKEDVDRFSLLDAKDRGFEPGEFAENLTTLGIDYKKVSLLDRFRIGDVELEVTQIGKKCHGDGCAIYVEVGKCVMPKSGIFTRVIQGGQINKNDKIEYIPYNLRILVVTVSDRAFDGVYEDLSGPEILLQLKNHFTNTRWHTQFDYLLINDDPSKIKTSVTDAVNQGYDVVITTGGTGIGPRDFTPDVIKQIADKEIPGIMEYIRTKYGSTIPSAVLSRSVAAVKNKTLIFALPGSVKASKEYTSEILNILEHAILMIHGLGH